MNLTFPYAHDAVREDKAANFFPGIVTARFHDTWEFYTTHLGFRTIEERGCSVTLAHTSGVRLAILQEESEGHPSELIGATIARGVWMNLEVENVAKVIQRLTDSGISVEKPSQRMAECGVSGIIRDPNGVLVFLIQTSPRRIF